MKALRTGLIIAFITGLMLLAAEGIARVFLWEPQARIVPAIGFGYSPTGYGDLLPNIDSIERLYPDRPYLLRTNSVGLRNVEEVNDDPTVFRILAIGDSFTYGLYVHNHETWPARLEEVLHQRLPGRFQVLNAGIPGYTIIDSLEYLNDKGLALESDLIIYGFYTNDIFDFDPRFRQYLSRDALLADTSLVVPDDFYGAGNWLEEHSALYNVLSRLRGELQERRLEDAINRVTPTVPGLHSEYQDITFLNPDKPEYADEWQAFEGTLRDTINLLDERNIPFVILAFPDLAQLGGMPDVPQQALARITSDTATPYLDLLPIFQSQNDIQDLYLMYYNREIPVLWDAPDAAAQPFTGDGHPSRHGYLLAARSLADLLIEQELVPTD